MDNVVRYILRVVGHRRRCPCSSGHCKLSRLAVHKHDAMGMIIVVDTLREADFSLRSFLQAVASAIMLHTRGGGNCAGRQTISRFVTIIFHCLIPPTRY